MLEHGQADVALGFFPDANAAIEADGDAGVVCRDRLYECEYVGVMRRDHPLAAPGALTLDAYCAADHLRVSFAGRPRGFVDEALARLGRKRRVMITVNQFFNAGSVVRKSDLLTVLPRSFVPATGFESELAVRDLPFDLPGIDVSMLWHRRHEQDTAQRWLRDTLARTAERIAGRTRDLGGRSALTGHALAVARAAAALQVHLDVVRVVAHGRDGLAQLLGRRVELACPLAQAGGVAEIDALHVLRSCGGHRRLRLRFNRPARRVPTAVLRRGMSSTRQRSALTVQGSADRSRARCSRQASSSAPQPARQAESNASAATRPSTAS